MSTPNQSSRNNLRQLAMNSAVMLTARVIGMLSVICLVPVLMTRMGTTGYGVWETLMATVGTAMVIQAVVSGTLLWRISHCFGEQNHAESRRVFRVGIFVILATILLWMPCLWHYRESLVVVMNVPPELELQAIWVLPAAVLAMLVGSVNHALVAVLTGYQSAGLAALIQTAGIVVTNVTAIAFVWMGFGLSALLIGICTGISTTFAIAWPTAVRRCGALTLWPTLPTAKDWHTLAPFAGLLLVSNLTLIGRDHIDKIILSILDSPAETADFGVAQRMTMLVMQMCAVLYMPLTAAIGALHAKNDWTTIQQLYRIASAWFGVLAGLCAFLVCTLRAPVFMAWLGHPAPGAEVYLAIMMSGMVIAITFAGAGVAVAKGTGRAGLETTYSLLSLVLLVAIKPIAVWYWSSLGSVASSAISWGSGALFLLILLNKKLPAAAIRITPPIVMITITFILTTLGWHFSEYLPEINSRAAAAWQLLTYGSALAVFYVGIAMLVSPTLRHSLRVALPQEKPELRAAA